jgi:hypothetical protein
MQSARCLVYVINNQGPNKNAARERPSRLTFRAVAEQQSGRQQPLLQRQRQQQQRKGCERGRKHTATAKQRSHSSNLAPGPVNASSGSHCSLGGPLATAAAAAERLSERVAEGARVRARVRARVHAREEAGELRVATGSCDRA